MNPNDRRIALPCAAALLLVLCACTARKAVQAPTAAPPSGAAPARSASEYLNATLWMQSAAEYRVCAETTYRFARAALDRSLEERSHSAALEQEGDPAALPAAVILDVDETVLDNSAYHARLILINRSFDSKLWVEWVARAQAAPVPGALEFVSYAAGRGVEVFFVTNREREEEPPTRQNLFARGFTVKESPDTLLVKGEQPGWGSDKTTRRAHIARSYRVLMLIGDDLNDFVDVAQASPERRAELAAAHQARWGRDWFMLPNPQYGSWERAAYGHKRDLTDPQVIEAKKASLRPY